MSGGSMNYIGTRLLSETFREHTPERMAFAKHLALVAEALTRIEWVDSGDQGQGDESEAIRKCLSSGAVLDAAREAAEKAHAALTAELERAKP